VNSVERLTDLLTLAAMLNNRLEWLQTDMLNALEHARELPTPACNLGVILHYQSTHPEWEAHLKRLHQLADELELALGAVGFNRAETARLNRNPEIDF
jgi:hypothetical protein